MYCILVSGKCHLNLDVSIIYGSNFRFNNSVFCNKLFFVVLPRELHPKIIELAIIFVGMYFMLLKFSDYIFCCPYQFEHNDSAGR